MVGARTSAIERGGPAGADYRVEPRVVERALGSHVARTVAFASVDDRAFLELVPALEPVRAEFGDVDE